MAVEEYAAINVHQVLQTRSPWAGYLVKEFIINVEHDYRV
jgi:hypothetical protein